MSTKYKAVETDAAYFITITTVGWVDLFTRKRQRNIIISSLKYCQKHRGLEIYAFCLMSSHLHMICQAPENGLLFNIIRDFKKFTSKKIIETINFYPESRKEWLLPIFESACQHLKRSQTYKVWQNGYHAEILFSNKFIQQKLNYIHNNPVEDKIVQHPEDYIYSSARNYAELESELEVILLDVN